MFGWLLRLAAFGSACFSASAVLLTDADFKEKTEGKAVFLFMYAPWCGHCKGMKADWERLAKDWEEDPISLVGEVDCTDPESENICHELNVEGFPTLLYGDPSHPEEYQGARDYESMSAVAKTFMGQPICGVTATEHCSEDVKKVITKILAMSKEDLLTVAQDVRKKMNAAQKELDEFVDEINTQFEAKSNEFNENVAAIKEEADFKWVRQALTKLHGLTPQSLDGDEDEENEEL